MNSENLTKQCAIIQFEAVHEETTPSTIKALNAVGYKPIVFINECSRDLRGDIFDVISGINMDVRYVPFNNRLDWIALGDFIRASENIDFCIFNTFQREGIIDFAINLKKPIIGIVHNVDLFLKINKAIDLFLNKKVFILTLAHHVSANLIDRTNTYMCENTSVQYYEYWGNISNSKPAVQKNMSIIGGVKFGTRDYEGLLHALNKNIKIIEGWKINVLGGGTDRQLLQKMVTESSSLHQVFNFLPLNASGYVAYSDYVKTLSETTAILPILPTKFRDYRTIKISSVIPTCIGFHKASSFDYWTDVVYRIPSLSASFDVSEALAVTCGTNDSEYNEIEVRLVEFQKERQIESIASYKKILKFFNL